MAAVALIFTMGIFTSMVSAQSDPAAAGFNSPLPGPGGQHGGGNPVGDLLDGIVDIDELMAEALGITVAELDAAKEAGTRIDQLIDELGLDAETVRQAVQDGIETAVEQAVADGLLTEEDAEVVLNPPAGHGQGNALADPLDEIIDRDEILADVLGITVEELAAAQEEGIRIDDLINELGLDADIVRQEIDDAVETAVEQAVTDGQLTEEEAEAILNQAPGQEGRPGPGGPGGPSGPGGRDGGEMPVPGDDATATDSETTAQPAGSPRPGGPQSGGPGGQGGRR